MPTDRANTPSVTCRTSRFAPKARASSRPYFNAASAASPKSVATRMRLSLIMIPPLCESSVAADDRGRRVPRLKHSFVLPSALAVAVLISGEAHPAAQIVDVLVAVGVSPPFELATDFRET